MKRAVIFEANRAGLVDASIPLPKEDWALVKVLAAPMCTEYKQILSGPRYDYLGHEAVGEVVEVAQPCKVKPGDRVVVMPHYPCGKCDLCISGNYIFCEHPQDFARFTGSCEGSAAFAQYLLKPAWLLPAIPEDISLDLASLALCTLGPSFNAFHSMGLKAYDTILICGAGPVGLGAVVNASYLGARVIVVESNLWRAERARLLGADVVINPGNLNNLEAILHLTHGKGVEKALDCSGVIEAQRLCIDAVCRQGQVAFIGENQHKLSLSVSQDLIRKGISLTGFWHYNLALYPLIMQVIRQFSAINDLISHTFPLSHIQQAFEVSASHDCAKVILKPWA